MSDAHRWYREDPCRRLCHCTWSNRLVVNVKMVELIDALDDILRLLKHVLSLDKDFVKGFGVRDAQELILQSQLNAMVSSWAFRCETHPEDSVKPSYPPVERGQWVMECGCMETKPLGKVACARCAFIKSNCELQAHQNTMTRLGGHEWSIGNASARYAAESPRPGPRQAKRAPAAPTWLEAWQSEGRARDVSIPFDTRRDPDLDVKWKVILYGTATPMVGGSRSAFVGIVQFIQYCKLPELESPKYVANLDRQV